MSEKYESILTNVLLYSKIGFGLSIAKDVGVLDVLRNATSPMTSQEIAHRKQLKERYVREILGCLSSVELIEVGSNEAGGNVYHITPDGKEALNKMYAGISMTNALIEAFKPVEECVPLSGPYGVCYNEALMKTLDEKNIAATDDIIHMIFNSVPDLKENLEKGISVVEFGSGTGRFMAILAGKFPKSTFTVSEYRTDLVDNMKSVWQHLPNMQFKLYNLCDMPDKTDLQYDWLHVHNVIHDLPQPLDALKGIRKLIKEPDGVFTNIDMAGTGSHQADVGCLEAAAYYTLSTFLCIPESFQREDSVAHGACWGKSTAIDLAEKAGFKVETIGVGGPNAKQSLFINRPSLK